MSLQGSFGDPVPFMIMQPSYLWHTMSIGILGLSLLGIVRFATSIVDTNERIRTHTDTLVHLQQAVSDPTVPTPRQRPAPQQIPAAPAPVTTTTPVSEPTSDTDILLPPRVHLTVPFTSQAPEKNWEQPWQDACEEAAILMLDAYYKGYNISPLFARDELLKLVNWQQTQGWGGSIDIIDIQASAAWYMQVPATVLTIVRSPSVTEIKTFLANKQPVLAVADGKILPNPYFSGDGPVYHALVIIGYDDTTGEFITNDPGTQFGKDLRYTYDDLMNSLRDWNNGDVKNGVPVVLVKR